MKSLVVEQILRDHGGQLILTDLNIDGERWSLTLMNAFEGLTFAFSRGDPPRAGEAGDFRILVKEGSLTFDRACGSSSTEYLSLRVDDGVMEWSSQEPWHSSERELFTISFGPVTRRG